MAKISCALLLVMLTCSIGAQGLATEQESRMIAIGLRLPGVVLTIDLPYVDIALLPYANLGLAAQVLGIQTQAQITLPALPVLDNLYFFLQAAYFYSLSNFGIPQPSHTGFFSAAIGLSVGESGVLENTIVPLGKYHHNIMFQYEYYIDSLQTSQALGAVAYYYSQPTWLFGVIAENDSLAFMRQDRFRTNAVEILTLFQTNGHTWGLALGNKIWTGTTEGGERRGHRGSAADLSNAYGGEYSHGILYAAGYYDSFKLSIGIDAEEIRQAVQNGFHFFVNQSAISPIPNISPRLYLQLAINPRFSLW